MDQLKYDSLYSGLVSINKSLGGTQSMPDSEYGAMIDLMETLSGQPVGESGDAYDAVSTVATMAENGELPIQSTPKLDSVDVDITANGSYEYQPSAYGLDGFSRFTANVNVPGGSRLGFKSVDISENGHQEFHAIDFDLDGFSTIGIDVNVPTGGGGGTKIDVGGLKLKFGFSTFTTIPDDLDFNNETDMSCMFMNCESLTTVPLFNTSSVTNMYNMFGECINLQSIPLFNTSSVTNMERMFSDCALLTSVPLFNTSSATNMSWMFMGCESLTTIPQLDTSKATDMSDMFKFCTNLTTIPQLDTSNATDISNLFYECYALKSIPLLDCGNVTKIRNIFGYYDLTTLTDLGGFKNIKVNFDIQRAPNLTVQSLMNVINNLYDFRANGDSTTTKTLTLGTTNLDKLTDEQKAVATNKGWQLS